MTHILKLPLIENQRKSSNGIYGSSGNYNAYGGGGSVSGGNKSVNFNINDNSVNNNNNNNTINTIPTTTNRNLYHNTATGSNTNNNINKSKLSLSHTSSELTNDLIQSLKQMQKHANMIKQSITTSQHSIIITNTTNNNKARQLVFTVAAERMKKAFHPFFIYELRRGFLSWRITIRQMERKERAHALIRFLTIRNVVLGINKLMMKV